MGSYAPRSPDLSAYHSSTQQTRQVPPPQPYRSDSFSIPQPSYYAPQAASNPYSQQQTQQQYQSPSYDYNMAPTFNSGYPQDPYNNGLHTPSAIKHEEPPWPNNGAQADQKPGRGRGGGGIAGLKSEQSMIQQLKNEPRVPAPGEAEGIVIRTKFPVARIKRIVQADEDVGKVAQVTPVVVSKALELFMISMTLSAAAEAKARGSKRVTGQHLKQAVQKLDQFDFLSEIVERIPDAPTNKESGKVKGEADEDEDDDDDEEYKSKSKSDKKPKRGRPAAAPGKRKKRAEREES